MSRQTAYYERQRAAGNCVQCGAVAVKKRGKPQTLCATCKKKRSVRNRKAWLARKEPEF